MPHLTLENRKTITSMLAHGKRCVEIAEEIGCDPTTVAKEIKLNRVVSKQATTKGNKILCKKLERFHYICETCPRKYTTRTLTQLKYDGCIAQKKYEFRLHETKKGINLTKEEYESLNQMLKDGLFNKRSVKKKYDCAATIN